MKKNKYKCNKCEMKFTKKVNLRSHRYNESKILKSEKLRDKTNIKND